MELWTQDAPLPSLIITEDAIDAVAGFPDANPAVVETTEPSRVQETTETFRERFDDAAPVAFNKPGYTAMLDAFAARVEASLVESFTAALAAAKAPETPALQLDPVVVSLLVGGYEEASFYQLSRWGENARVGSRAKFSRRKQALEEEGLIETAKISRPVGRPRQRLLLGDVFAEDDRIEDVIATAIEQCSEDS